MNTKFHSRTWPPSFSILQHFMTVVKKEVCWSGQRSSKRFQFFHSGGAACAHSNNLSQTGTSAQQLKTHSVVTSSCYSNLENWIERFKLLSIQPYQDSALNEACPQPTHWVHAPSHCDCSQLRGTQVAHLERIQLELAFVCVKEVISNACAFDLRCGFCTAKL